MNVYDGMLLSDAETRDLPDWLNDDNAALELVAMASPRGLGGTLLFGKHVPPNDAIWRLLLFGDQNGGD